MTGAISASTGAAASPPAGAGAAGGTSIADLRRDGIWIPGLLYIGRGMYVYIHNTTFFGP